MKKGFTLIELLAVIVIVAIIALIAIPVISGVVDKARMGAAKDSAYGVLDASDLFNAVEAPAIKDKMVFTCDGEKCANSEGKTLQIKGTIPTSGNVILNKKRESIAEFLVINKYCFSGKTENLKGAKNCYELDTTKADLTVEKVSVSSESVIIRVVASDSESKIKEIKYEIDGKEYKDSYLQNELDISKKIENLKENIEYELKVTVTNENNLSETKTITIKTDSLGLLLIKYENTPNTSLGVYQSQTVYLDYNKTAKGYYVKSERQGTSNISPKKECGEGNVEGECNSISNTTIIEANKWYYFYESPRITYNTETQSTSSIYARATDGYNVTSTTSGTLSAIDRTKPTCTLTSSISGVSFASKSDTNLETFGMNTTGSTVYNETNSLGLSTNTFYGYVKDKAGNEGVCTTSIVVPTGVSMSPTSPSLNTGGTVQLTATVSPSNATYKNITWATSNGNIASVSASGLVTAKGPGTATITATTHNGKKTTATITVSQPATGISLNRSSASINIGSTVGITATVTPSNASNKTVTWTSSNTGIATVSGGTVTGKSAGTVTITASTHNGYKAYATIIVVDPTPTIDSCPDCVYAYTTDEWYYGVESTPSTLSSSQYKENYEDVVSGSGKNYFLGIKLNASGTIEKAYACGIKDGETFCLEGSTPGSTSTYNANKTLLQSKRLYNNGCGDGGSGGSFVRCVGSVNVEASAIYVSVFDGVGSCRVHRTGALYCIKF